MKKYYTVLFILLIILGLGASGIILASTRKGGARSGNAGSSEIENAVVAGDAQKDERMAADNAASDGEDALGSYEDSEDGIAVKQDQILHFVDAFGEEYQTEINQNVPMSELKKSGFVHEGDKLFYEDGKYSSRLGVDVSHHQGYIDWEKVKKAGYDFAFIRIGYRGYGESGTLNLDQRFYENIEGAHKAGLDVGVYLFSQAINLEEAKEEALFVIEHLKDYDLELPVVYDPESILDAKARTDNVSGEQFTKNTIQFCTLVSEAGYKPMVYSNMLWEAFQFDMSRLSDYPFWYADYEAEPQTPYRYAFWQYTSEGHVDGISGSADLNIEIIEKGGSGEK